MNIEHILNDALNKAMCQKGRIQNPDSNKVAEFVNGYLKTEKLPIQGVVVPKGTLKTNKGKCPCKMPFSQTWCEEHERWT
jgi:hypothetical protein